MEELTILQNIEIGIFQIVTALLGGGTVAWYWMQRVGTLYGQRIKSLEQMLNTQIKRTDELAKKNGELLAVNDAFREAMALRDPETVQFRRDVREAIDITAESRRRTEKLIGETNTLMTRILKKFNELLTVSRHIDKGVHHENQQR